MAQLTRVVAEHGEEAGATCLYAQHDPKSRCCRLTSAGHPPPAIPTAQPTSSTFRAG